MQAVRSILVVLDPEHAHSRALTRAKLIAGVTGAARRRRYNRRPCLFCVVACLCP